MKLKKVLLNFSIFVFQICQQQPVGAVTEKVTSDLQSLVLLLAALKAFWKRVILASAQKQDVME